MKTKWRELYFAAGYSGISAGVVGRRWKQQFRSLNAEDAISFILAVRFGARCSDPHALEEVLTKRKKDATEEWEQIASIRLLELVYPFVKKFGRRERTPRMSNPTTGHGGLNRKGE